MKTTDGAVRHVPSAAGASAAAAEGNAQAEDEMATFTVTNTNDSGAGSLRQAISGANARAGADEINFSDALRGSTISLTTGALEITGDLTISGLGADALTIADNSPPPAPRGRRGRR